MNLTTVLLDAQHHIDLFNPNDNAELKSRKLINRLKEKRNSKRSTYIKAEYTKLIAEVEAEHNLTFNA